MFFFSLGLPKAAYIPYEKVVKASWALAALNISKDDIIYTSLPLYHSAASLLTVENVIRTGMLFRRQMYN